MHPSDRLIVALDHENILDARDLTRELGALVNFYKIGMGSLTIGGGALALELLSEGKRVFIDLKFFDIPATVERAIRGHAGLGVDFLTVHGDPGVVRAAAEGKSGTKAKILAVTVLTSADRAELDAAMIRPGEVQEIVAERAMRAFEAGADGVIASGAEASLLRALPEARGKLIVTPGIRPRGSGSQDQKRVVTPLDAIRAGADHIVIGRPIYTAPDPVLVAKNVLKDIEQAIALQALN